MAQPVKKFYGLLSIEELKQAIIDAKESGEIHEYDGKNTSR